MWGFTPDFCESIPRQKAANVITTITDYNQDPARDEQMLATLLNEYETVSLWLQGNGDRKYASSLPSFVKCELIPSTLEAFDAALDASNTDYVGTRLHGGIRSPTQKAGVDYRHRQPCKGETPRFQYPHLGTRRHGSSWQLDRT